MFQSDQLDRLSAQPGNWQQSDAVLLQAVRRHSVVVPLDLQQGAAEALMSSLPKRGADRSLWKQLASRPSFFAGKPVWIYGQIESVSKSAPHDMAQPESPTRWLTLRSDAADAGDDPPTELRLSVEVDERWLTDPNAVQDATHAGVLGYVYRQVEVASDPENPPLYVVASRCDLVTDQLPMEVFSSVHNRMPLSDDETEAYYRTLYQCRVTPPETLKQAAVAFRDMRIQAMAAAEPKVYGRFVDKKADFPVFVDLFRHADSYQGHVVELTGRVREVVAFAADANPFGLENLYEVRMFPEDGQRNPAIIICSEIPAGFPLNEPVVDGVTVRGYCFKIYAYPGEDPDTGTKLTRFAPMVLARRLEWTAATSSDSDTSWWIAAAVFVTLFILLPTVALVHSSLRDRQRSRVAATEVRADPDFTELDFTEVDAPLAAGDESESPDPAHDPLKPEADSPPPSKGDSSAQAPQ